MRRHAALLVLGVLTPLASGVSLPALAQDNPMKVIIYDVGPKARPAPQARAYRPRKRYEAPKPPAAMIPVPEFLADGSPNPEYKPGAMMPAPDLPGQPGATPPAPALPEEKRPVVALIGDSLAEALGFGFGADDTFKGEFTLRQKTVSASGLVRDDFQDWPKALPGLLGAAPQPAAVVVMLGLNDRQILAAGGQSLAPLSEGWREAYGKRIDAVIAAARASKVPLIWVGLPAMRHAPLSTDLAQINAMMRDRVTSAGETFVEVFDAFADASGTFAATGPDILGDTVRLRGPDGIHFTPAGQRKLAYFVERALRKRLEGALVPAPAQQPAGKGGAPGEVSVSLPSASLPAPKPVVAPVIKQRPEIGETRPLGAPATAAALSPAPPPVSDPATEALFSQGLSPAPRTGRADDYRWK